MSSRHTSRLLSTFDMQSIALMAFFLAHETDAETIERVISHLDELKLEYNGALQKNALLENEVRIDPKTGAFKYDLSHLRGLLQSAAGTLRDYRTSYSLSYFRFDIDDFSTFNNRYGHDIGDLVLKGICAAVRSASRGTDFLIRFGGEEFDLILHSTERGGAAIYLDELYIAVRQVRVPWRNQYLGVTISGGLTGVTLSFDELMALTPAGMDELNLRLQKEADDALYEAKLLGKDRYCGYDHRRSGEYHVIRTMYQKQKGAHSPAVTPAERGAGAKGEGSVAHSAGRVRLRAGEKKTGVTKASGARPLKAAKQSALKTTAGKGRAGTGTARGSKKRAGKKK